MKVARTVWKGGKTRESPTYPYLSSPLGLDRHIQALLRVCSGFVYPLRAVIYFGPFFRFGVFPITSHLRYFNLSCHVLSIFNRNRNSELPTYQADRRYINTVSSPS